MSAPGRLAISGEWDYLSSYSILPRYAMRIGPSTVSAIRGVKGAPDGSTVRLNIVLSQDGSPASRKTAPAATMFSGGASWADASESL
jgi:hypothetical protein